jgi:DNA-binding XRE family transcriptional regulator
MSNQTKDNLRRLLTSAGWSIGQVAELTGLDKRTIRGILNGVKKPHIRTLHRLAQGLGVSVDELFLDPAQLLYRRFDRLTNPMVEEVLAGNRELFEGWTQADFDELHSRVGMGGALTAEGALAAVRLMNRKRQLHRKLELLLESTHAEVTGDILDLLYEKITIKQEDSFGRDTAPAGAMK